MKKNTIIPFPSTLQKKKNSNYVFHAHVVGTKKNFVCTSKRTKKKYFIGCLLEQGWPLP